MANSCHLSHPVSKVSKQGANLRPHMHTDAWLFGPGCCLGTELQICILPDPVLTPCSNWGAPSNLWPPSGKLRKEKADLQNPSMSICPQDSQSDPGFTLRAGP